MSVEFHKISVKFQLIEIWVFIARTSIQLNANITKKTWKSLKEG